jgi:hypothetical protein
MLNITKKKKKLLHAKKHNKVIYLFQLGVIFALELMCGLGVHQQSRFLVVL